MELINCNTAQIVYVQVEKGDNLDIIAHKFNVDVHNITRNNPNIDLYEGEIVKINRNSRAYHIVKPMETLPTIASKYNTSIDELISVNNLVSKRLFVGQNLIIPTPKN